MALLFILGASLLAQAVSAFLALKLFQAYGRRWVWIVLGAGAAAAAGRSGLAGLAHAESAANLTPETAVFALSLLLALGLGAVDSLFRTRLQAEEAAARGEAATVHAHRPPSR